MENKFTKQYANKLADKSIKGTTVTELMRMSFVHGYMEAVNQTAATELLEALEAAYQCSGEYNHLTKPVLDKMLLAIKKAKGE